MKTKKKLQKTRCKRFLGDTAWIGLILGIMFLASSIAYTASWPDEIMNKVNELHELANAKKDMPPFIEGIPNISGDKAYELWKSKKAVFLDNRVKTQYDTEKISGALWYFCDDFIKQGSSMAEKLDKNKEYIVYCNGVKCWRSPAVAIMLHSLGFKVYWYRDGLPDWKKRGYPTE